MVTRRVVIRGAFAVGLTGSTGLSLSACGDDSASAGAGAPAMDLGASTEAARTPRPRATKTPRSKSDVYQRGPEHRPSRTTAPGAAEPAPEPVATAEPTVGSHGGDQESTARQGERKAKGRPTATPAPLPPGAFARTSEIPVGGGRTYPDQKIVVTQPTAGEFKGFSATCTHAGCLVDKVEAGQILCPCHGSRFSIADGKVLKGPALLPLPEQAVAVGADGSISKG
ncbi:MAG TPA: Rieske (2Fe-2S) protein [Sporichthya sp.]|nr:Rieske (2Fe-2S) protein [Sporichthya sp.]